MKTKRFTALLISIMMILQMFVVSAAAAYIVQEDNPADIKFTIPWQETEWSADGIISEGEYEKIHITPSQISIAASSDESAAMAITIPISLYMSYDRDYVYFAAETSAKDYICEIDDSNEDEMWAAHAVQLSLADINATKLDQRLETGYALSSLDNNTYSCTWFDPMGIAYDADNHGDYTVVKNENVLVYEMRVPFEAFVEEKLVEGDSFLGSVLWAVGTSKKGEYNYTNLQLGYGISGDPGKDPTGHATFTLGDAPEQGDQIPEQSTVVASGVCGEQTTWSLDSNGVLTFSGTGMIQGYETPAESIQTAPYRPYAEQIKSVVIEDGIEFVGSFSFLALPIESVSLPDSILSIGQYAFSSTPITEIELPKNLTSIGFESFSACTNLTEITIPSSVTALQNSAFDGCTSLKKAVFLGNATQSFGNAFTETADDFTIYYYEGATGWTTPTWTAPDGTVYNTVMIDVNSDEVETPTQTNHGNIAYISSDAITVDGVKDSVYADVTPIAVKYEGGQAVTDMTDGNANVYLATNNGFLYVYAEINDTEVVTPTEQQQTEWPWGTDSLEMFIHSGDIYQFRVDNTGYPSFYLNPNGDIQAYGPDAASDYFISYADGKIDGGYTVEFCIDLKNFGVSSGTELGINFQLNDRSEDGSQRFIYNGVSDSWNVDMYDRISIGVGESYVASAKPVPPIQKIPESNRGYVKNIGTTPITVDAQMDESVWVNALQIPIDCLNSGENTGTSGIAYLLWAENKWYLTVDVKDADVVVPTEEAQQNHPWTTDSVEIFFDFGNQHKELVKQYRIDCAGYPSYYVETGAHYAYGEAAKPYFGNYAVNITDDGYIIEMCINMEEYHLIDGYEVGIQLQINDMKGNNPDGAAAVYNMWSAMGAGSWDVHAYDYVTLGGIARGIIPHVGSSAVVVDGEKDAAYTDGMDFAVDTLVAGNDTGTSADAYMLTDNGLLYLYAEIADNDVVDPDPNLQSTEPWFTDSLELFIQEMHSEHIHQFRVDHSNYPSYYMNSDGIRQGYGHDAAAAYMKAYSAKKTDTGYIVEMCIDLKQFAVSAGEEIGIQMQINDRRTNGDQSFYHLNKGGAFDPVYYESAVIGVGEDYAGRDVMLGTSIGDVPYIKPDRIVIDGQYSSVWDNALKVEIDQFNNGDETCGTGATAHMYWTEGKWYLFVDVKDNDVAAPDPIMQENEPWRTDSVEMFFDFGHEHSDLVKQFRIDCSGYPSYYEEHGINYAYGEAAKDYFDEYKVLQDEDGYNIEMVIDLSKWGLAPGDEIGIQLQLNDTTTAHPTEWRSCWNMHQSMGAGSWDAPFYDYVTLKAKPVEEVKSVEIPVTEDKDTPSVKVEEAVVQGSTVTIDKIDESALENVFDAPVEEPDDGEDTGDTETKPTAPANTVTIDVSNVKSEDSAEAEKVQQVTVPATVVDTIKKAAESKNVEDAKLAVHLSTGSIIIDKTTMDVISKVAEAEEGKTTTVSLVIDDADDNLNEVQQTSLENIAEDEVVFGKLEVIMEVTKTDNTTNDTESEKIHDFNGGTVQLEVPFEIPEGYAESGFTVYYLDDDGNLIPMETQYSNGKITWTTGHFSDYIILYKELTVEEFPEDPVPEMPREPIIVDVDQIVDDLMDSICNQITDISDRLQKTAEDAGKQLVDRLKETAITYVKDKVNDLAQCWNIDLCKLRKDIKYFCNLMP